MKIITIVLLVFICFLPSDTKAQVFKCKDKQNEIVYSSKPCDIKSQTNMKNSIKQKNSRDPQETNSPVGSWFIEGKPIMVATIASCGSFQMTDIKGHSMRGSWQKNTKGAFKVNAAFMGVDMFIKMKYDVGSDTLFLSKPGFVNSFSEYKRR